MNSLAPDRHALQGALTGEVVLPGSRGYESVSKPAIARFHDVRPRAVVRCETPEDVSETSLFARRSGLDSSTRSGGRGILELSRPTRLGERVPRDQSRAPDARQREVRSRKRLPLPAIDPDRRAGHALRRM
jgi:hypothetical protein